MPVQTPRSMTYATEDNVNSIQNKQRRYACMMLASSLLFLVFMYFSIPYKRKKMPSLYDNNHAMQYNIHGEQNYLSIHPRENNHYVLCTAVSSHRSPSRSLRGRRWAGGCYATSIVQFDRFVGEIVYVYSQLTSYSGMLGPSHFSPYGFIRPCPKKPSCARWRTLSQEEGSGFLSH